MTSPSPKTNVNDSKTSTLVPSSSFPSTLIVTTSLLIGLLAFLGAFDRICIEDLFRFQSDIFFKTPEYIYSCITKHEIKFTTIIIKPW